MKKKKQKKYLKIIIPVALLIFGFIVYLLFHQKVYATLTINNQEITLNKGVTTDNVYLESMNTDFDTIIRVKKSNCKVIINDKKVSRKINVGKQKISKDNVITVKIKYKGEKKYKTYYLQTYPANLNTYQYEKNSEEIDGEYYLSTYLTNTSFIFKINSDGDVTFYKKLKHNAFNFRKTMVNDKPRYTYLEEDGQFEGYITSFKSKLVVLDEHYNKVKDIYFNENEKIESDHHDYVYFDDNHYILATYEEKEVDNFPGREGQKTSLFNLKIREMKDGKPVFEFNSTEYPKLYNMFQNDYNDMFYQYDLPFNYLHLNAMSIDPTDDNLLCSFRILNSIIKINRKNGKIVWILGGTEDDFHLTSEQQFYYQHSPITLSDGRKVLFDNGIDKTRILVFKLDETNKTVSEFYEYPLEKHINGMGSVRTNNDGKSFVISYGTTSEGNNKHVFEEVDIFNQKVLSSVSFDEFKCMEDYCLGSNVIYSVNKY